MRTSKRWPKDYRFRGSIMSYQMEWSWKGELEKRGREVEDVFYAGRPFEISEWSARGRWYPELHILSQKTWNIPVLKILAGQVGIRG